MDITERTLSENALRQSEENYRAIFNAVEDAIFVHDPDTGEILDVNERVTEIWGHKKEEILNMDLSGLSAEYEGFTTERALKAIHRAAQGEPQAFDWRAKTQDGRVIWIDVHLRRVTLNGHERVLALVRDITDRKNAEELLLQAEILNAVAELATGVSHNFNNVLQKILAGTQSAILKIDQAELYMARSILREIAENAKFGSETVKRLQSFAQLRSDVASETAKVFDLSMTVKDAAEMSELFWRTLAVKNGVSVSIETDLSYDLMVHGVSNDIFEVTLNLLRNAIESISFSGVIRIRTYALENQAILEVKDNGVGITPENLPRIFDPFFTTKGLQSTGMGLASAYGIVTSHGGSISVDSEVGVASTFTVALPLAKIQRGHVSPTEISPSAETCLRFLIIDDDEVLLSLFEEALISTGQHVRVASSGHEAFALLGKEDFDVITCDLGMPHMNGWEVGRRIRHLFERKSKNKPPIILLTGWGGQTSEREKMVESGIDIVVEKPVDITELIGICARLVSQYRSGPGK